MVHSDWEGVGGYADVNYPEKYLKKMLTTLCEEYSPHLCDIVFCASNLLIKRFAYSKKIKEKCIYIPCGGSPLNCKAPEFTQPIKEVVYIGTYNSHNLVTFLTKLVDEFKGGGQNLHFTFIGGGTHFSHLKESLDSAQRKELCTVTGQLNRDEVLPILEKAHFGLVYLNSEYPDTYMELSRSSTKIFEYMSSGKIIVASNMGEPYHILQPGKTGFLLPNSPQAFAKTISNNYSEDELVRISQSVQKDFTQYYSHDVLMKKLADFCKNLSAKK